MLIFDQLRISDDGRKMYISIHINKASYFENVYLDSITITTADKVLETVEQVPSSDYIYHQKFGSDLKEADLVLNKSSFDAAFNNVNPISGEVINPDEPNAKRSFEHSNFSQDLFFVYIKCKLANGEAYDPCIPCVLDDDVTLGVTFDTNLLYQRVMDYTKQLGEDCTIPQGFTDFILLWNAFKAAVETEHYIPAIKFYNMLFGNASDDARKDGSYSPYGKVSGGSGFRNCGCHGRNSL